jgi:hypothetical protein
MGERAQEDRLLCKANIFSKPSSVPGFRRVYMANKRRLASGRDKTAAQANRRTAEK